MRVAAGRLFVDVTQTLATPAGRAAVVDGLGKSDPRIKTHSLPCLNAVIL